MMFETSYVPSLEDTGKDPGHNEKMLKERLNSRPLGTWGSKGTETPLRQSTFSWD